MNDGFNKNIYRNPLGNSYNSSQRSRQSSPQKNVSTGKGVVAALVDIWNNMKSLLLGEGVNIHQFPTHLYPPQGSRTFDFKKLVTVPAGTTVPTLLWEYEVKDEFYMRVTHYAIFNDALFGDQAYFIPSINDQRILNFHGDPSQNFLIYLGNTADLSGLASANILLRKGQKLQWKVVNTSAVAADMGARMIGYIDPSKKQSETRFGG